MQQYNWSPDVRQVTIGTAAVAVAVTEFGFPLRYAADVPVQLAA